MSDPLKHRVIDLIVTDPNDPNSTIRGDFVPEAPLYLPDHGSAWRNANQIITGDPALLVLHPPDRSIGRCS